ncbi:MAG: transcriptional repressor [Candidatus Omnitrophica bacterium]|nr:transcriptional repressor [Candidatus Omnitrophota bacterium]
MKDAALLKEAEKSFSGFLETQSLKLTSQRRTILGQAIEARGHFSADRLLDLSKKKDPTISKATVYRTLALLKESKILEEQDFGDGRKVYERALGHRHHDHFICIRCGKIIEFENDEIEKLQDTEAAKCRFKVVYHSLKLFGFCQSCS